MRFFPPFFSVKIQEKWLESKPAIILECCVDDCVDELIHSETKGVGVGVDDICLQSLINLGGASASLARTLHARCVMCNVLKTSMRIFSGHSSVYTLRICLNNLGFEFHLNHLWRSLESMSLFENVFSLVLWVVWCICLFYYWWFYARCEIDEEVLLKVYIVTCARISIFRWIILHNIMLVAIFSAC